MELQLSLALTLVRDGERCDGDPLGEHVRAAECVQDADPVPLRLLVSLPVLVYDRVGAWVVVNDSVAVRLPLAVMHVLPDADSDAEAEPVSVDEGLLVVHDAEGVVLRLMLRVSVGAGVYVAVADGVEERETVALVEMEGLRVHDSDDRVIVPELTEPVADTVCDTETLRLLLSDRVWVSLADVLNETEPLMLPDPDVVAVSDRDSLALPLLLLLPDADVVRLRDAVLKLSLRVRVWLMVWLSPTVGDAVGVTEGDPEAEAEVLMDAAEAVPEALDADPEGVQDTDAETDTVLCDSDKDSV